MISENRKSKARIIVLFGGESAEHDVSCVTAAHVLRALDPQKYDVTTVGITRDAQNDSSQLVVIPLLHGPMGEDGTVQGLLELAHVAYVGTGVLGSAVAMDKSIAKQIMSANSIAQQKFITVRDTDDQDKIIDQAISQLGLPVFVKPANMGSSIGVKKAKTRAEIVSALTNAFEFDEWALIEEAVTGREIEVAVLGNENPRASVPGEIVPSHEFYDYEDKYIGDGAQLLVPAPLSESEVAEVQQLALKIYRTLRSDGMARVDFFYEKGGRGFLCNEINTIPGFTPISMYPKLWQASGLSYSQLLDELIELAIARHTKRRNKT
ncbi:MAG: hypothetical protein RLZZ105_505 [Actinomycetota bacterium]